MAVFLDTNVFLFAAGADHPLRKASQDLLHRVAQGQLAATTSTEVVQEILYVLHRRGLAEVGRKLARNALLLFPDLLPITRADMRTACDLLETHPDLPTRDAVHAATALNNRLTAVITADTHFRDLEEVHWVPLAEAHLFKE